MATRIAFHRDCRTYQFRYCQPWEGLSQDLYWLMLHRCLKKNGQTHYLRKRIAGMTDNNQKTVFFVKEHSPCQQASCKKQIQPPVKRQKNQIQELISSHGHKKRGIDWSQESRQRETISINKPKQPAHQCLRMSDSTILFGKGEVRLMSKSVFVPCCFFPWKYLPFYQYCSAGIHFNKY